MLIPPPFPRIYHTHHSTIFQGHSLLVACYHIFIKIAIYDPSCKNILSPKAVFPRSHHPLRLDMKQLCKYTVLLIIVHKLSSFMLNHSYKEAIQREPATYGAVNGPMVRIAFAMAVPPLVYATFIIPKSHIKSLSCTIMKCMHCFATDRMSTCFAIYKPCCCCYKEWFFMHIALPCTSIMTHLCNTHEHPY